MPFYATNEYYAIIPEMNSDKGYTDVFFFYPVLIVELKYNKTSETAIR